MGSTAHALFLSLPIRLAQGKFLDLPGRCFGQRLNEFDGFRGLKMCHTLATEADQVVRFQALARLEHDESLGHLSPLLIRDADDGGLERRTGLSSQIGLQRTKDRRTGRDGGREEQ